MAVLLKAALLLVALVVLAGTRAAARGVGLDGDLADGGEPTDGPAGTPLCPRRCECPVDTKVVNCSSRRLKSFPELSEVPEDVVVLDLSDNLLKAVPRSLPAWDRLEVLTLAGNQLTDFPPFALGDLPALEMLDLSRNKITSLRFIKPDRFIANNPVLQVLNLSGNALQDLGHGSFTSLSSTSLSVLDVSHCSVSSINGEEALREVPSLTVLRVAGNPLHMLPALQAPALRELDVSGCRLRTVTARVLSSLPQLTHLVVSHNPDLASFQPPGVPTPSPEQQLSHLINGTPPWSLSLQVLEAEGCALHDLSFLETLPNLTEVRLRGNRISWLESLLDNGLLQLLDLADNQLESLPPDLFKGADLLRELDLSGNRLTALHPATFSLLAALRKLNVSRNPLASLQLSAPSLRVLDASHAGVQVLPEGVLDELPQLRHLNLSNNPLPQLPDRLASAGRDAALHSLDVSLCRLADMQVTTLDGLPLLQTLDLRGNRFTDPLKVAAFSENPVLHHLRLGDNPWRCDCWSKGYRAFVKYIQAHPVKEDTTALACHSPEKVQGETWHDACLAAGNKSLASMDTWMFVVILGLCVVLVAVGVLGVRRFTRGKGRRRRRQQEEEEERRHEEARQQLQQELRRQHVRRIQPATMGDPDGEEGDDTADYAYHPPSYEEAVLMDRMTQEDPPAEEDSDSDEDADDALQRELHNKIARVHSGRHSPVIEEEEDDEAAAPSQSNGVVRNNTKL